MNIQIFHFMPKLYRGLLRQNSVDISESDISTGFLERMKKQLVVVMKKGLNIDSSQGLTAIIRPYDRSNRNVVQPHIKAQHCFYGAPQT